MRRALQLSPQKELPGCGTGRRDPGGARVSLVEETELESRAAKADRVHRSEARKERAAQRENPERPFSSSQLNNGQVPVGNKLRLVRGNSHQGHTRPTNQTRKPHS